MAPYYIVLQFVQMSVINPPLCHRPESGIDSVNDLVPGKFLQELVAFDDPGTHSGCDLNLLPAIKHSLDIFQCKPSVYCYHCLKILRIANLQKTFSIGKKRGRQTASLSVVRATQRLLCDDASHLENLV